VVLVLALPMSALARQRVYDYAQIFSAAEKQEITDAVDAFIGETGMDYAVVTTDQDIGGQTHHEIARDYYRTLVLGAGEDASGALYYLNMNLINRYEYLYTDGKMIDYMNDARIGLALDQSNPKLRDGLYKEGALAMIAAVQSFVKQGIPSNQFRYDVDTGEILSVNESADAPAWMNTVQKYLIQNNPEGEYRYNPETDTVYFVRKPVITVPELLVGAGACLLIGLAFALIVSSRYKLKGSTYRYDYRANTNLTMTESTDQYLRTTVTRTRRVQASGGGGGHGGGFGGGGGGSGVHSGGGGGGGRGF
jgi:uncharacterized protein